MAHRRRLERFVSLRFLLVAVLAAMTLIPLGVFWAWSSTAAYRHQIDDVSDRHLLIARNLGAALTRYHRDITSAFEILSRNAIAGHPVESAAALLENLAFRHVCVVEVATGKVIASLGPAGKPCPDVVPRERLDMFLALEPSEAVTVTGVMPGPHGEPTMFLLCRHGDLLSIGALTTTYFRELGEAISFGHKGHAAIVDQHGRVLAHPRPDWLVEMKQIAKIDPVARMIAGEYGISQFYSPALKADMIAGFTAVPGAGWGVMIPQPVAELRAAAERSNDSALLVLGIGLCVAVGLGLLLSSRLTAPLRAVTKAAHEMADGDSGARADIRARHLVPHELRELQTTFNAMGEAVEYAEFEERTARLEADAANKTKSYFLANVSHELRTPLNAIVGFSEMISSGALGPVQPSKYGEYAGDILDSATHLQGLIDDLLDISRIEVGELTLEETDVDVEELLETTAKMVGPAAEQRRVSVAVDAAAHAVILVDARRFSQMLLNLAGNAIRFTPAGGHVRLSAFACGDGAVELAVIDDGNGIAKADLQRVQEPFQRGGESETRDSEGVGMGLAIVRQLALAHGAEFHIESSPGQGTRTILRVPPQRVVDVGPVATAAKRALAS